MKRARSGEAFVWLIAPSELLRRCGQRGQLKHARNDHARMLRLLVARSGVAGGGRWVALEGALEARPAHARLLAL